MYVYPNSTFAERQKLAHF